MGQTSESVLREQLATAIGQLFVAGVMSHSGHGNFSVRLPGAERRLLVSRRLAGPPRLEEIALVTFEGEAVSGRLDPGTREIVAMHVGVYRQRPAVGSVMHTHSRHVTTYALAYQPLPCVHEGVLRLGVADAIPVAEWAPRGSAEAVGCIVEQLARHPTTPAVLLGNHGLLALAADPLATARLIIIMEEAAELDLAVRTLGGARAYPMMRWSASKRICADSARRTEPVSLRRGLDRPSGHPDDTGHRRRMKRSNVVEECSEAGDRLVVPGTERADAPAVGRGGGRDRLRRH